MYRFCQRENPTIIFRFYNTAYVRSWLAVAILAQSAYVRTYCTAFWPNDQALGAAQPANDGGDKKGPAESGLGDTQASRLLPGAALASAVQRVDVQAQGGVGLPTRTGRPPARPKTSHLLCTYSLSRGGEVLRKLRHT